MKLFIISALIALSGAARLEHLEAAARGNSFGGATSNQYLPPFGASSGTLGGSGGSFGGQGGSFGSQNGGFGGAGNFGQNGAAGRYNDATSSKYLPPFGGESNSLNSFDSKKPGASSDATSNKYLPPFQGAAGARSPNSRYQQPGFGGQQNGQFGGQGQQGQYGSQGQFGSQGQQGQFGSHGQSGQFGSHGESGQYGQAGQFGQAGQPGQFGQNFGGFNQQRPQAKQYRPGQSQQIPTQDFDEETGYHY